MGKEVFTGIHGTPLARTRTRPILAIPNPGGGCTFEALYLLSRQLSEGVIYMTWKKCPTLGAGVEPERDKLTSAWSSCARSGARLANKQRKLALWPDSVNWQNSMPVRVFWLVNIEERSA